MPRPYALLLMIGTLLATNIATITVARAQAKDTARASAAADGKKKKKEKPTTGSSADSVKVFTPPAVPRLFRSETPLTATFTLNIKQIRKERGDNAPWHAATISYPDSASGLVTVPMRARTRGIWRLKNCEFPPIRIKVRDSESKKTLFHDIEEPKLVNFCRNNSMYEEYILQEFMLYRVYQLLTPVSQRVRLVRMTYVDSATSKTEATRYGFIAEDPVQLAARLDGKVAKEKGAKADDLDPTQSAIAFLFQYMIGNTDFSFGGLHNSTLIRLSDGNIVPVAYDFDYAGAVNATYATPDPTLRIKSVRDRQFRGYCAFKNDYVKVLDLFKAKKDAIYALYADSLGQLLQPRTVKETLSYFDDFYKQIQLPRNAQRQIFDDCVVMN